MRQWGKLFGSMIWLEFDEGKMHLCIIYPGKSISKVLKPIAGSGLVSETHFTVMGLVCTVEHSDK